MFLPQIEPSNRIKLVINTIASFLVVIGLLLILNSLPIKNRSHAFLRILLSVVALPISGSVTLTLYSYCDRKFNETIEQEINAEALIRQEEIVVKTDKRLNRLYENDQDFTEYEPIRSSNKLVSQDLIKLIANYDGHIMISSRTGSGKTTIVLTAIAYISERFSNAEWYVIDPKYSGWLGLESQEKVIYPQMDNPDTVQEAIDLLTRLTSILRQRQQARNNAILNNQKYNPNPIRLIIDEWLTLVAIADSAGLKKELVSLVQNIFYTGREDKVFIWISGQTHAAKENGFSTGVRDNLGIVALGRNGNYASIEKALNDAYLIPSKVTRDKLFNKFELLSDTSSGITYTNLSNHDLFETPNLDSDTIKRTTLFTASRVASEPDIITIDTDVIDSNSEGYDMPLNANSCPKCYSENTVKHGGDRRRCKDCGKTFSKKK
jgi:hypothetical protein